MENFLKEPRTIVEGISRYRNSEKTALICEGRTLSYQEFYDRGMRIAENLAARGIEKGDRIVLAMKRSENIICMQLGIILLGCISIYINQGWPPKQRKSVLQSCLPKLIVDDEMAKELQVSVSDSDMGAEPSHFKLPEIKEEDPFQIVYTSGSTGIPKGAVCHHLVAACVCVPYPNNELSRFEAEICAKCLLDMDFSFVLSTITIMRALFNECSLVIAVEEELSSPARLASLISGEKIDMVFWTPSLCQRYISDPEMVKVLGGIRRMQLAGEGIPEGLMDQIRTLMPKAALFFSYGSSEMMAVEDRHMLPGTENRLIKPIEGIRLYVLNEMDIPVKKGESGELCIGGAPAELGGYWNDAELTQEKYRVHPKLGRLFHTGDMAVVCEDGSFRLSGRADQMVKLRGMRINLDAIEKAVCSDPQIREAASMILGEGREQTLVLYYTRKTAETPPDAFAAALRRRLAEELPYYMVPVFMKELSEMPLNFSGKLDRRALWTLPFEKTAYQKAKTPMEKLLARQFAIVLGLSQDAGANDSFFSLGGDSISGLNLAYSLSAQGVKMKMKWLFAAPTPALLAQYFEASGRDSSSEDTSLAAEGLEAAVFSEKENGTENEPGDSGEQGIRDCLSISEKRAVTEAVCLEDVEAVYPFLSNMRRRLSSGDKVWFNADLMYLKNPSDEEKLRNRFFELAAKRQMLRTVILCPEDAQPMMVVLKSPGNGFFTMDLRWMSSDEAKQKRHIRSFIRAFRSEGFPAGRPAVMAGFIRLDEKRQMLLILYSHYLLDGMSVQRIVSELLSDAALASDAQAVSHFFRKAKEQACSQVAAEYWEKLLKDQEGYTMLAKEINSRGERIIKTRRFLLPLEPVREYCGKHQVTPAAWIHALLGMALTRMTGSGQAVFASVRSGRTESLTSDAALTGGYPAKLPFVYREGDLPENCQMQLLESSQFCMFDFFTLGSEFEKKLQRTGYVCCDILNFPLAEGTIPDNAFLAEDNYTEASGEPMKVLEMFFVLGDGIYITCIYNEDYVSTEAVRTLERQMKGSSKEIV